MTSKVDANRASAGTPELGTAECGDEHGRLAATGAEPDGAAILADLDDEQRVHEGRLNALERERLETTERVIRGTATRDELTAITRQILETKEALQNVAVLRTRAAQLAGEQAAAAQLRAYHAVVDQAEASFAEARHAAQELDAWVDQGGALVARCRGALDAWQSVTRAAEELNPRLAKHLDAAADVHAGRLFTRLATRLQAVGVLTGRPPLDSEQRAGTVASAVGWTKTFLRVARDERAIEPGVIDDSPAALIRQLSGRATPDAPPAEA